MNKIFFILVMFLLVALPVSALKMEYSNNEEQVNDMKVIFSDTILFGLIKTGEQGSIELKSHETPNQILKVGAGNQVTMFYDFNFLDLYENGLGDVKFIDKRTNREVNRDYSFVYWGNESYEVPISACTNIEGMNGTIEKDCSQIGTETKTREKWLPYNSRNIPKGNIRIGLQTYVELNDYVDGIWTIQGKEITKHASWTASLENGLVTWWKLNEASGNLNDVFGLINLIEVGGNPLYSQMGVSDITETAIGFDSTFQGFTDSPASDLSTIDFGTTEDFSFNFWVLFNSAGTGFPTIFDSNSITDPRWSIFSGDGDTIINWRTTTSGVGVALETPDIGTGDYHMVTGLRNNTGQDFWLYIDGELNQSDIGNTPQDANANNVSFGNPYFIRDLNGIVDEFGIWNRTLTEEEITTLYNNNEGCTYQLCSIIDIELLSPEDNENFNQNDINFQFNVSDPGLGIQNVTIDVYNSTGLVFTETNSSGIEGIYNFTNTFEDGSYDWNATVFDVTDERFDSETRNFTIDSTPQINVSSPLNQTYPTGNIDFNATSYVNIDYWIINYNGTNITISDQSGTTLSETLNVETGNHQLLLYANNSESGVFGLNDSIFFKVEDFILNNMSYSLSTFETKEETFTANITTPEGLNLIFGKLIYNETTYSSATITNPNDDVWLLSRTIDIPLNVTDNEFFFNFTLDGTEYSTETFSQEVNLTLFTETNATYPDNFLNVSFKDENTLSSINASVPLFEATYYLGSGTVNKTISFTNNTDNFYYEFSGTTGSEDLKLEGINFQYRRVNDYPQRIWQPSIQTYNSTVTDEILYLLNTNDGIFVTYQVLTGAENPIEDVDVTITRQISGETIQVGAGTTDSAGTITFWLNPDFQHTATFNKEGFDELVFVHFPTQASYTITLGEDVEEIPDFTQGILQTINPNQDFLTENEVYNFNYTVSSSYWNLTSIQFTLTYENGTLIGSNSLSTSSGGTISLNNINISNSSIIMDYLYTIDDDDSTQISGARVWIVQTIIGTEFGIWRLAQDFNTYVTAGLFGFDDFGKTLISFIIMILTVGGMSRRYGIASEGAIMGMLFGIVFFLDVGLGLIPRVQFGDIMSINNFYTYITFIILLQIILREETR
jgi:hypothetical protein